MLASRRASCARGSPIQARRIDRVKQVFARFVLVAASLLAGPSIAAAAVTLPTESHVPGGVVLLPIQGAADSPPTVKLGESRAMVVRVKDHWVAVVGVPLSTEPGPLKISIEKEKDAVIEIKAKQYRVQKLKVAPKMVDLAPEDQARTDRERPSMRSVRRPPATSRWLKEHPAIRASHGAQRATAATCALHSSIAASSTSSNTTACSRRTTRRPAR